jgi:hypothetical protein
VVQLRIRHRLLREDRRALGIHRRQPARAGALSRERVDIDELCGLASRRAPPPERERG